MRVLFTALFIAMLAHSGAALAGHDHRGGRYAAAHEWARYYADTAVRQVRQNRRQHCNYYGQRWSVHYDDHYYWALRVSRGQAQSEINRRDRDLRHCWSRHGGYYGYRDDGYRYYGDDHRRTWRHHGKSRRGHSPEWRGHHDRRRADGHGRRHGDDDGWHDSGRDRRDGRRGG